LSPETTVFNCINDNALISQLLAHLELGHEVDTGAKAHSFVNLSANEYGRESFPLWGGWISSRLKKLGMISHIKLSPVGWVLKILD
jgi:hypothetical protein